MGWWFGRKSAPADARPFVPAWLSNDSAEVGFASAWELGALRGSSLLIDGQKVVGSWTSAIAAPAGGSTIDAEARAAIGQVLAAMRLHGLIEM